MVTLSLKKYKNIDDVDIEILRIIQSRLPISTTPWLSIARKTGLREGYILERVKKLKSEGVIRRIGGNFDSQKLGWVAVLCAAQVKDEIFDHFVEVVNAFPGVTHNYRRKHFYNIWFTLIAENFEKITKIVKILIKRTGVKEICLLRSMRKYKIKVDFPL